MGGSTTCRKRDKTVYILGAGFSRPAGIPVLGRFIPKAFEILKESEDSTLLERFTELVRTYQAAAGQMRLDADNLETLFCLSDLSEQRRRDRSDLVRVIARTVFKSCNCHNCDKAHREECCVPPGYLAPDETINAMNHSDVEYGVCIYKAFLSHIFHAQKTHAGDKEIQVDDLHSVITFNYDLVLETAMKDVEDGCVCYGEDIVSYVVPSDGPEDTVSHVVPSNSPSVRRTTYGPFPPNTLHYLKIHGSLNWVVEDGSNYSYVTVRPIDAARQGRQFKEIPLVPPTWKRGTRDDDIYSRLLSEAIEHLRIAGRIVIIGYSMPDTDTYFKYVLATALDAPEFPRIEVWDVMRREEMMPRLTSIFGSEKVDPDKGPVHYKDTGLRGFVKQEADRLRDEEKENQ
jgi:hypothetical protein